MLIYQKLIKRDDLRANPGVLYVFGDNLVRQGYGGQAAEMRGEPNAVGIPTKVSPSTYLTDADYAVWYASSKRDYHRLFNHKGVIVYPSDLEKQAPLIWNKIKRFEKELSHE